jgi:hypothetical protein
MGIIRKKKSETEVLHPKEQEFNSDNYLFDLSNDIPQEQIVVSIQGKNVGSIGNAVVITGKPKSRKSVIAHAMIGAALSDSACLGIECNVPDDGDVVLIDTEQSKYDLYKSLNRMKSLCSFEDMPTKLKVFSFRQLNADNIKVCISQILLKNNRIRMMIIDGGLDLINNMNDVEESKATIDFIKKILSDYQIVLVMILHQSKSTNFTIGHFGSFMDRFAQSNIEVIKDENGNSKIKSQMMRSDADFKSYDFYFNHNVDNYTIDWHETGAMLMKQPSDIGNHLYLAALSRIFNNNEYCLYKDLVTGIGNEYEKTPTFSKNIIVHLFNEKLLIKTDLGIKINK